MRRWRLRQLPPRSVACAPRDIGGGTRRRIRMGVTAVTPPAGGRRPAGTRRTEQLGAHPAPARAGRLGVPPSTPLAAPLPPFFGKVCSKRPLQGPPLPPATKQSRFQVLCRPIPTSPGTEAAVEYAEKDLASVLLGINHWVWVCPNITRLRRVQAFFGERDYLGSVQFRESKNSSARVYTRIKHARIRLEKTTLEDPWNTSTMATRSEVRTVWC